jgi:hypothetical protein
MESLFAWWDGVELWLVQLPYPPLVTLVLVVLLPVTWVLGKIIDRAVDRVGALLTRFPDAEPPLGKRDRERPAGGSGA